MNERKIRNQFMLLFLLSYMTFSFGQTKFTPFLSEMGFNPMERGLVLSAVAVGTMVLQVIIGYLMDKFQTAKIISVIALAVQLILGFLLFDQTKNLLLYHFLVMGAYGGLCNTMSSQFDLWVMGVSEKMRYWMSSIMAFGSFGWAIGSLLSTYFITHYGYTILKLTLLILVLAVAWVIWKLPDTAPATTNNKISKTEIFEMLKQSDYLLFVVILFLLYSLVVANNGIILDKMLMLGATDFQISFKWSLQSMIEIPMFFAMPYLMEKIRPLRLIQLSAVAMFIQFVIYAWTDSVTVLLWLGLFQMFSIPILLVPSKIIIARIAPRHLQNTAQMTAISVYMGVSSLIIPSVVGFLATQIGFDATILGLSLMCAAAFLGTIVFDHL